MTIHNKLVRDGIPALLEKKQEPYKSHIADDLEYSDKLYAKLIEEAGEVAKDRNKEEVADVLEVLLSLIKLNGWSMNEIEEIRLQKLQKLGGFEDRIILEES
ncbi:MAG: hypothetical protein JWL92_176 [Candidatus Nomurabacteria bacterium]|nr:hypothetical protein [Candidatus Nomurabacteria bacterium]